jgi:hypothetical protein
MGIRYAAKSIVNGHSLRTAAAPLCSIRHMGRFREGLPSAGQHGPPDAGSHDPARRIALGPSRVDQGAAAGRGAEPEGGGVRDRHRQLSAVWPRVLNFAKSDGPFSDVRARRALNYCTNREALVTLLNELA